MKAEIVGKNYRAGVEGDLDNLMLSDTSIGTLKFREVFPDDTAVQKVNIIAISCAVLGLS